MESVGSNSPESDIPRPSRRLYHHQQQQYCSPMQQLADRISRALTHRLRLLHRSDAGSTFFVLGATGNVYTVTLSASPTCTCPDRAPSPCKHLLFVLIRVLSVPLDDACVRRCRALRPTQLRRLLRAQTAPDALAGARARERFHQLFSESGRGARAMEGGGGAPEACPVCLDEMGEGGGVVACGTCGNALHEECLAKWKRSRGRRAATCVMCRARWRERREREGYVNLAAYAIEDGGEEGGRGTCAG